VAFGFMLGIIFVDQVVTLVRLVDVDGIEEGHVKARQPHIHHDRDFEIGLRLLELGIELLALVLVAEQIVERLLVVLAPRYHDSVLGVEGLC